MAFLAQGFMDQMNQAQNANLKIVVLNGGLLQS